MATKGYQLQQAEGGIQIDNMTNAAILAIASPVAGQLVYSTTNNILYQYDSSRTKWLSVETIPFVFGNDAATDNEILTTVAVKDINSGYRMPLAACIVRSTIQQDTGSGNQAKQYNIQINGATSFSETTASGVFTDNAVNTELSAGDRLNIFVSATGTASTSPDCVLFVKFRCV